MEPVPWLTLYNSSLAVHPSAGAPRTSVARPIKEVRPVLNVLQALELVDLCSPFLIPICSGSGVASIHALSRYPWDEAYLLSLL
jgi:hypothetical protein